MVRCLSIRGGTFLTSNEKSRNIRFDGWLIIMSCTSFQKVGPSLRHNKSYERTDEIKVFAKWSEGSGALCTLNIGDNIDFFRTLKSSGHFSFFFSLKTVGGGRCLQPLPESVPQSPEAGQKQIFCPSSKSKSSARKKKFSQSQQDGQKIKWEQISFWLFHKYLNYIGN